MEWFRRNKSQPSIPTQNVDGLVEKETPSSPKEPLKVSSGDFTSVDVKIVNNNNKYLQLEFEQKIQDITESLDEKAKENMALVDQQNILKERIRSLEENIKKEEEYSSIQTISTTHSETIAKEYRRRLETLTESLVNSAIENVELRENIYSAKVKLAFSLATEVAIKLIKESKGENEIVVLKAECLRLRQREESYKEAVEGTYEANIREISQKMRISLSKEQEKRRKAESDALKLSEKIGELENKLAKGDGTAESS